jgi:histidyl-tRNA synthetase
MYWQRRFFNLGGEIMLTTRPRGTNDFLPGEVEKWQHVENVFRDLCHDYAYGEIRTPIFEHTELFMRGVGETTDIVEKEMYTFKDRSERSITLRPENTAPVVRAFLEHKLYAQTQPTKLYYIGPMFRYDKPQAGRYRQFHQVGAEILGTQDPAADAETIVLAIRYLEKLGLEMMGLSEKGSLELYVNSIGCPDCRPTHMEELKQYLQSNFAHLCPDCQNRFDRNPLRILDCKNEQCRRVTEGAPDIIEFLCDECSEHFSGVKSHLDDVKIPYHVNPRLVRGLDYYTKTTFEITSNALGSQSSVCGGGRYDGLVELCGGEATPGVGFAMGVERLILTVDKKGNDLPGTPSVDVFIASIGQKANQKAFQIADQLRHAGFSADMDMLGRSLRGQMKYADKVKAAAVIIIGDDEIAKNVVAVRMMQSGEQVEIQMDDLVCSLGSILAERGEEDK